MSPNQGNENYELHSNSLKTFNDTIRLKFTSAFFFYRLSKLANFHYPKENVKISIIQRSLKRNWEKSSRTTTWPTMMTVAANCPWNVLAVEMSQSICKLWISSCFICVDSSQLSFLIVVVKSIRQMTQGKIAKRLYAKWLVTNTDTRTSWSAVFPQSQ